MDPLLITILVVLAALACVLLFLFFRLVWLTEYNAIQVFFWLVAKCLNRFMWRTTFEGSLACTDEGGAVIISNHRTSVDPFFVQIIPRRVFHWMVAREYCENWATGWFFRMCEAIPVNRGGIDTTSTKMSIRYASEGSVVGIFPEGGINTTDQLMRAVRPGAIVVALKARVPIVPCYIEGAPYKNSVLGPLFMRARVRVCFGEPIDLSPYYGRERDGELVRQLLVQCVKAIAQLAGQPDFEPKLAGRNWKLADPEPEDSGSGDAE